MSLPPHKRIENLEDYIPSTDLNTLTAAAAELNTLDITAAGAIEASKAVVVDSNKDIGDFRNLDCVNLDAGKSGTAGTVDVFASTASKGKFVLSCTDQDGDTAVTLKPAAMGQATVVSIPDPGAATANVLLTDAANDGVVVTATAAELNAVADVSAMAAIAANGDTLTVTAATHAGKVVQFGKTTGTIVTLPAATGTGHTYKFVIGVTATSNANIIKVANATDVMDGSVNMQQDTDVDGTYKMWRADAGDDTMTFAGAAGTGGIVGGFIECTDYKAGFWSCQAFTQSGGRAEVTPFSATVAEETLLMR